jgi:hypothetical protein
MPGGRFTERLIDGTSVHGQSVEIADMDGDGDADVVASFSLTDTVRIYASDGAGTFTEKRPIPSDTLVAMHAAPGDYDGDGDVDLAAVGLFDRAVGFDAPGEVTWFESPGSPDGSWTKREITGLTFRYPRTIASGDLTGDGRPDLVVGAVDFNGMGNGLYTFTNTGGAFTQAPIDATLRYVAMVLIADVDGDAALDVLASSYLDGELVWYENDGSGGLAPHPIAARPGAFGLALADMDGDPALEAVASGDGGISWYDPGADPRAPWTEHVVTAAFGAGEGVRIAAADFDGEGSTDVVMTAFATGELRGFFGDGAGGFSTSPIANEEGVTWVAAADLDGDARVDLVTSTYNRGAGDRIVWWKNEP